MATGVKSSPYPDEQALKDYLKRLSDQTLAEHASKNPTAAQIAQVSDNNSLFWAEDFTGFLTRVVSATVYSGVTKYSVLFNHSRFLYAHKKC